MKARVKLRLGGVPWREVEGEIVALDLRTSSYFGVNKTGTVLWPTLQEGATRAELVARLTASFGIDEATAAADLDAFLVSLRERGLLEEGF